MMRNMISLNWTKSLNYVGIINYYAIHHIPTHLVLHCSLAKVNSIISVLGCPTIGRPEVARLDGFFLQYWHLLFGLFNHIDIVWKCRTVSRAPETCRDLWTRSWQQGCDPRLGKDNRGWKGGRRSEVLPVKRWEIVTFWEWSDGNFFWEWSDGNFFESDRMVIFWGVMGW